MKIVTEKISLEEVRAIAKATFGNLVKAVIDIEQEIMVLGGELHSDEEAWLLENGSQQKNLWGINIYPELKGDEFIEFDSLINLRPSFGNQSRGVESQEIKERILKLVDKLIEK